MKLREIKGAIAAYLNKETDDLIVNSVDLGLVAMNQVRQQAELNFDLQFSRKLVVVNVNGLTGGSLEDAVFYGTSVPASVKGVVDVGLFDDDGNFVGIDWTTVGDSLNISRSDNNSMVIPRYPTDGQATRTLSGGGRLTFSGSQIMVFPKATINDNYVIGVEAYTFMNDWTPTDLNDESDVTGAPWNTVGSQYLLYGSVIHLNNLYKEFVFRQQGNLPPPKDLRDEALNAIISWDIFRYEQHRRHDRR